jgi:hypothetical protein
MGLMERAMENPDERARLSLTRQLHTWELLEGELTARLADDPGAQQLLEAVSSDAARREMLTALAKADPDNPYLRSFSEPVDAAASAAISQELERILNDLEADDQLGEAVRVARQGADAVVLGEELVVVANLLQNIALIAMPVALVLAARIKRIGDVEFYEGVPKHLVDVVKGLKGLVPGGK